MSNWFSRHRWGKRGERRARMGTPARPYGRTPPALPSPVVGSTVAIIDGDKSLDGIVIRSASLRCMPHGVLVRLSSPLYGSDEWWFSSYDYDTKLNGWRMP